MPPISRRKLMTAAAVAAAAPAQAQKPVRHIGMLVYPGFYLPDLVGPWAAWDGMPDTQLHFLWKSKGPVDGFGPGLKVEADMSFAECPKKLDVLFVPGATMATVKVMEDAEVLRFLAKAGSNATWVTSVCTGSLILGAAGLLKGYKATTHWVAHEVLPSLGATPVKARIVEDRNRITGGGVTAGLDFGLTVAARLAGETYAKTSQLILEYNPQPPFHAGSPEGAGPEITKGVQTMFRGFVDAARKAAERKA